MVKDKRQDRKEPAKPRDGLFPVVGIGASAGDSKHSLSCLITCRFDTGMGFVLVQHLDPVHESALTKLLSKVTSLPVDEVTNNTRVEPDHVYVIPPKHQHVHRGRLLKTCATQEDGWAVSFHRLFLPIAGGRPTRAVDCSGSVRDRLRRLTGMRGD